jgi:hypothetical protein
MIMPRVVHGQKVLNASSLDALCQVEEIIFTLKSKQCSGAAL